MKKYLNFNTLYIAMGIIAVGIFFVPRAIDMVNLQVHGISHIAADVERYYNTAHLVEGEYTVEIDLRDLASNEGKMLFEDEGGNQIYVSKVVQNESGYEVVFRSSGSYNSGGGELVSGTAHTRDENGYTHDLKAEAQATYNGDTFNLKPASSSGLNYRNGDEFGFYLSSPDEDVDLAKAATIELTLTNLQGNLWVNKKLFE